MRKGQFIFNEKNMKKNQDFDRLEYQFGKRKRIGEQFFR